MSEVLLSICIPTVPPRKKYLNRLLFELQNQILKNNLKDKIEILVYLDDFELSVGEKQNFLIKKSVGKFCVIIDDDDMVHKDYCKLICEEIEKNPNVDQIAHYHRYYHNNNKKYLRIKVSKENDGDSIIFFGFLKMYIKKYYSNNTAWELKMNVHQFISLFEEKERTLLKAKEKSFKLFLIFLFIVILKRFVTVNLRYTCNTTPIKRSIFEAVNHTSRSREEDLEWAAKIYELDLIKTESIIEKDLYYYYFNENMSINRGTDYKMSKDEKEIKLKETESRTVDFDWDIKPINDINIIWVK